MKSDTRPPHLEVHVRPDIGDDLFVFSAVCETWRRKHRSADGGVCIAVRQEPDDVIVVYNERHVCLFH